MRKFDFIGKRREQFRGHKNLEKFRGPERGLEFHSIMFTVWVLIIPAFRHQLCTVYPVLHPVLHKL